MSIFSHIFLRHLLHGCASTPCAPHVFYLAHLLQSKLAGWCENLPYILSAKSTGCWEKTQLFSEGCDVAETNPYLGQMKPGSVVIAGSCIYWGAPSGFWSFWIGRMQGCCIRASLRLRGLPSLTQPLIRCSAVHRQPLAGLAHRKLWLLGVKRRKREVLKCHRVQEDCK